MWDVGRKYYKLGGLFRNRNFFFTVVDGGKSKMRVLADSVSGESPFSGSKMMLSCCVFT